MWNENATKAFFLSASAFCFYFLLNVLQNGLFDGIPARTEPFYQPYIQTRSVEKPVETPKLAGNVMKNIKEGMMKKENKT